MFESLSNTCKAIAKVALPGLAQLLKIVTVTAFACIMLVAVDDIHQTTAFNKQVAMQQSIIRMQAAANADERALIRQETSEAERQKLDVAEQLKLDVAAVVRDTAEGRALLAEEATRRLLNKPRVKAVTQLPDPD